LARESAERAVALDDHDALALRSLGLCDLYARRHDDAIHNFRRAIDLDPHEAENIALLGAALSLSGDYESACEHVQQAIRLSPHDIFQAPWYSFLGMGAVAIGQDEEALEWARLALRQNPQFPGGYRTLATAHAHLGQIPEARAALGKLLTLLPDLTIRQLRESLPFKDPDALERYLDGLRKAGVPD
jgi:tetratricopeptide (TPR) repeat protein